MSAADISALVIALREGVEMTLIVGIVLAYLTRIGARRAHRFVWAGVGAALGFAIAIGIGVLIYVYGRRLDLATFFRLTGIMLIVFAAGLVTHGVHEFVEAGLAGGPTLFDLSQVLPDSDGVGAVLRTLIGYSADPTLLEGASWGGYFLLAWALADARGFARRFVPTTEGRPAH